MKSIIISFIIGLSLCSIEFACTEKNTHSTVQKIDTIDWDKIEEHISNSEKRKVLKVVDDHLIKSYEEMSEEMKSDDIYSLFHVVDLNNDKKKDIIFSGYGGAAEEYIMIILNQKDNYNKIFQGYGHITKLGIEKMHTDFILHRKAGVESPYGDSINVFRLQNDKVIKITK